MSTVYSHADDKVSVRTIEAGQPLPAGAIWVDMLHPTEEERAAMSAAAGTTLPTQEDMMEIEASSRIYQDGGTSFLTASVVAQADTVKPETGPLTRSEEHTSELQSLMRISYAVFCLKKTN